MMNTLTQAWRMTACYRAGWLALAVFHAGDVIEIRRHRITADEHNPTGLATLLADFAHDYGCEHLVVEPDSILYPPAKQLALKVCPLTIAAAKEKLLAAAAHRTHQALYDHLLERHPPLQRLVTLLRDSKKIAATESWRTVLLLAVALGLAAHERSEPSLSQSHFHS